MYRIPGMPKWQHRLLLDLACNPSSDAEEIAAATGFKLSTCERYLSTMTKDGLVSSARHADEIGRLPNTYSLTEAGEKLFEETVSADAALQRLAQRARRRSEPRLA